MYFFVQKSQVLGANAGLLKGRQSSSVHQTQSEKQGRSGGQQRQYGKPVNCTELSQNKNQSKLKPWHCHWQKAGLPY